MNLGLEEINALSERGNRIDAFSNAFRWGLEKKLTLQIELLLFPMLPGRERNQSLEKINALNEIKS